MESLTCVIVLNKRSSFSKWGLVAVSVGQLCQLIWAAMCLCRIVAIVIVIVIVSGSDNSSLFFLIWLIQFSYIRVRVDLLANVVLMTLYRDFKFSLIEIQMPY